MNGTKKLWDRLEVSVFHSRVTGAAKSIVLVVLIQLVISALTIFFLVDLFDSAGDPQKAAEVISTARWCIVINGAGFLLVAILSSCSLHLCVCKRRGRGTSRRLCRVV